MSNNEPTVSDFVSPIPVCRSEADLGTILQIFECNDCSEIAIPLADNGWGIIRSTSVLSLFAKLWQQKGMVALGHSQTRADNHLTIAQNFNDLIEPAIVLSSKLKLAIFLQTLNSEPRQIDQNSDREYLVVDELGQLKGNLKRSKILKHLASADKSQLNFAPNSSAPNLSAPNPTIAYSVAGLLDMLILPWKIETLAGQHLHCNSLWSESFPGSKNQVLPNVKIANWWIEQQYGKEQSFSVSNFQPDYKDLADSIFPTFSTELETMPGMAQSCAALNVLYPDRPWVQKTIKHPVEIEQKQEWCLIKIPVSLYSPKELAHKPNSECLLTIAAQGALSSQTFPAASPVIIQELLAILNHELKSPLTGIVGLSSLLQERQLGKLNQRQKLYAQLIHNSGHKLMGIVNDLLELQSLDQDGLPTVAESISIEDLCRQGYQQSVARLEKLEMESELGMIRSQLKLEVAPESTVTIPNKSAVIGVLSRLMLETLEFADSSNHTLVVKVDKQQSNNWQTAIVISNEQYVNERSRLAVGRDSVPKQSSGWNLVLAKYLTVQIKGKIQSHYTENGCQLTLFLPEAIISKGAIPDVSKQQASKQATDRQRQLTILCLYPETEATIKPADRLLDLDFRLKNWLEQDLPSGDCAFNYQHRIIEADGLEQAHTLARIWQLDVILLNGQQIADPLGYLKLFQESPNLSALPLITLDTKTTEAANQIEGLNVYPCLIPAQCCSISDLVQVIQIATDS